MRKRLILGMLFVVASCQGSSLRKTGTDGSVDAIPFTGGIVATGGIITFGGSPSAGGLPRTGGMPLTGGVSSTGGSTLSQDAGPSSCDNPLPLRCGDRLIHSTTVQGRPDTWSTYGCSARWMSGRETLYAFRADSRSTVTVRLKNSTLGLFLLQMQTCAMMACSEIIREVQTFTVEAGATKYLVVDGADGIEGSYQLEVDCGTPADGGTVDARVSDAPEEVALPVACSPGAVTPALSPLGLTPVDDPTFQNPTISAAIATDPNWGLKATVCKEAGYDLSPVAGKTVCLIGQNITQRCQGFPAKAWIVLHDGAVACVYKTVVDGFPITPGVYSATDPSCVVPAIDPGVSVSCEGRTCTADTGPCCPALSVMSRTGMCSAQCKTAMETCDGPEDCPPGSVCCSLETSEGFWGSGCVDASACESPSRVICKQGSDCPAGQTCVRPNPLPKEILFTATRSPNEWRVDYKVCAP